MIELSILFFLIRDLAVFGANQLARNVAEHERVHDHFILIEKELQYMKSFLEQAAEGMKDQTKVMQRWVGDVKEAAYQVEDLIDEFMYLAHSRTMSGIQGMFHNMVHGFEDHKLAARIAANVQRVRDRLLCISETMRQLECNFQCADTAKSVEGSADVNLPCFDDGQSLFGRETSETQVIQWLISDEQRREAVWVAGMGGLGKTTFAKAIYNHPTVAERFDLRAWVSITKSYNIRDLLRSIAHDLELQGGMVKEELDGNNLSELLTPKRYLIVLDDIWDFGAFTDLLGHLPENKHGSRILVTTRNASIITPLSSGNLHVLNIRPLSDENARSLFHKAAFGSATCPPELDQWAGMILSKCQGLPLAIVAIGRVMAGKPKDSITWKNMCQHLEYELSNNEKLERMVGTLMLSYKSLPYHLQRCFLYCSLFKEGQPIKTKWLIRKWIAEGFIIQDASSNMTDEDIGTQYVKQLVQRSMLQVVKEDVGGWPKVCRLHDIMRDLALKASQGENICVTTENQLANIDEKCRRLSIMKDLGDRVQHSSNISQLRTILVFPGDHSFSTSSLHGICKVLKFLRVLDLRGAAVDNLPSDVFHLFNIRYLSLRETSVNEMPGELGNLYNLQVLDIWKTNVTRLPREIVKLRHLRHLYKQDIHVDDQHYRNFGGILRGRDAPSGISDLSNLQTLKTVKATQKALVEIAGLMQLRHLGVTNLDRNLGTALCKSISRMEKLSRLSVKASDMQPLELEQLSPPADLQKLILNGRLKRAPAWFSSLSNLTHLYLFDSWLTEKESPIQSLKHIPCLSLLALAENAYQGGPLHFESAAFRRLKILILTNLRGLSKLSVENGGLPNLQVMYLRNLKNLRAVEGTRYVTRMRDLHLRSVPIDPSKLQLNHGVRLIIS